MDVKAQEAYQDICEQLKAEYGAVWGSCKGSRELFEGGFDFAIDAAIEMLKGKKTLDK